MGERQVLPVQTNKITETTTVEVREEDRV